MHTHTYKHTHTHKPKTNFEFLLECVGMFSAMSLQESIL